MSLLDGVEPDTNDRIDGDNYKFEAPGDVVEGEVLEVSPELTGDYGVYKILTIRDENFERPQRVLAGSVLLDKIEKAGVSAGGTVAIRFDGMKQSVKNKSRSYKNWTVRYAAPSLRPGATAKVSTPARNTRPSNTNTEF